MEGLLILGLLIAGIAGGGSQPAPQDFGPPAAVEVELVSLRLEPEPAYRGREVYGYLSLTPVVADSPTRTVEELEGPGQQGYLPGLGLIPRPFRLVADGRWHSVTLREDWRRVITPQPAEYIVTSVNVFPLVNPVGPHKRGEAALDVALCLEGSGWAGTAERVWFAAERGTDRQVAFETPMGRLMAFLRVRAKARIF